LRIRKIDLIMIGVTSGISGIIANLFGDACAFWLLGVIYGVFIGVIICLTEEM